MAAPDEETRAKLEAENEQRRKENEGNQQQSGSETTPRSRSLTTYIVLWRKSDTEDGLHELAEKPKARTPEAAIEQVDGHLSTNNADIAVAIPASSYHVHVQRSQWSKVG